jgi:hypothetical protein
MYSPATGLAGPDTWTGQILTKTLVVLGQPPELELGHGLLVRAGAHDVQACACVGGASEDAGRATI